MTSMMAGLVITRLLKVERMMRVKKCINLISLIIIAVLLGTIGIPTMSMAAGQPQEESDHCGTPYSNSERFFLTGGRERSERWSNFVKHPLLPDKLEGLKEKFRENFRVVKRLTEEKRFLQLKIPSAVRTFLWKTPFRTKRQRDSVGRAPSVMQSTFESKETSAGQNTLERQETSAGQNVLESKEAPADQNVLESKEMSADQSTLENQEIFENQTETQDQECEHESESSADQTATESQNLEPESAVSLSLGEDSVMALAGEGGVIQHVYMPGWDNETKYGPTGNGKSKFMLNGEDVFCVEPHNPDTSGYYHICDIDPNTFFGETLARKLSLVAYFGTKVEGRQGDDFWAITQGLIWKLTDEVFGSQEEPYWIICPTAPDKATLDRYWAEILSDVQRYDRLPSFAGETVTIEKGQTVTLTDHEGVLQDMTLQPMSGIKAEISNNTLKLTAGASDQEMYTVSLTKNIISGEDGKTLLYGGDFGQQKIARFYISDQVTAKVHIKVIDRERDVEFLKCDANTKEPLSGALLKLVDSQGNTVSEWISSENPHVVKLSVGASYKLVEVQAPKGYIPSASVTFTIKDSNQKQTVVLENNSTNIKVSKINGTDQSPLTGARLQLTDSRGQVIDTWITQKEPKHFERLTAGETYTLTELEAVRGFATAAPVKFTVAMTQKTQEVSMTDESIKTDVSKLDEHKGIPVEGAKLAIYPLDDNGKPDLDACFDSWTSTDEPHRVEYIPVGRYILRELSAPTESGYVTCKDIEFEVLDTGEIQTVKMEDDHTKLEVSKVNASTGDFVEGAVLAVYPLDENDEPLLGDCFIQWTSGDRPYLIEYIPVGRYILREITAPAERGYVTAKDVVFEIKDTGEIQKVKMADDYTKIDIKKTDITTGAEIKGATLAVYPADENGNPKLDSCLDTWISDGSAHRIEYIPVGRYILRELSAPYELGYVKAEDVAFEVRDTGIVQKVEMKDDHTKIDIYKLDKATGENIAGAKMRLEDQEGKAVKSWVTDETPFSVKALPPGEDYHLVETCPAPGYATAKPVKFTVEDTAKVQKAIMEDEIIRVLIHKVDSQSGQPVVDAALELKDGNGNVVDQWKSDGKGHMVERLTAGEKYILEETDAPENYELAGPVEFVVLDTPEVQVVSMSDEPSKQIVIPEIPKTGDEMPMKLVVGVVITSGVLMLFTVGIYMKRRNRR